MFRLVRWLLLMAVIAALTGFLLTWPIAGETAARRVCLLAGSPGCAALADQAGVVAARIELPLLARLLAAPPATRPTAGRAMAKPPSRPLDRHTPAEEQALARILAQRGSH